VRDALEWLNEQRAARPRASQPRQTVPMVEPVVRKKNKK
jgi:hypothetical protein